MATKEKKDGKKDKTTNRLKIVEIIVRVINIITRIFILF